MPTLAKANLITGPLGGELVKGWPESHSFEQQRLPAPFDQGRYGDRRNRRGNRDGRADLRTIRVLVDDLPEAHLATELMELVDRLRLPSSQLDLLLDIGPVMDSSDAGKRALAAVDVLGALVGWRRVVLMSGAFPRTLRDLDVRPTRHVERHDWQLNRFLRAARSGFRSNIVYGDYSTEH